MSNLAIQNSGKIQTEIAGFSLEGVQVHPVIEKVIAENGNLIKLSEIERKAYYLAMCDRYGLDPFSSPFDYMKQTKWNKETRTSEVTGITLYPNKRAAEGWGEQKGLTIKITSQSVQDGLAIVVVQVSKGTRIVEEIGAVEVTDRLTRGDALKKAITQARRRGILAFCGFSTDGDEDKAIAAVAIDPPSDVLQGGGFTSSQSSIKAFDRAPTIAAITASVKRLKMTQGDVCSQIKQAYQVVFEGGMKEAIAALSDAQLIDYADYLESLQEEPPKASPKPAKPKQKEAVVETEEAAIVEAEVIQDPEDDF